MAAASDYKTRHLPNGFAGVVVISQSHPLIQVSVRGKHGIRYLPTLCEGLLQHHAYGDGVGVGVVVAECGIAALFEVMRAVVRRVVQGQQNRARSTAGILRLAHAELFYQPLVLRPLSWIAI